MPPAPSGARISYGPRREPASSGTGSRDMIARPFGFSPRRGRSPVGDSNQLCAAPRRLVSMPRLTFVAAAIALSIAIVHGQGPDARQIAQERKQAELEAPQ